MSDCMFWESPCTRKNWELSSNEWQGLSRTGEEKQQFAANEKHDRRMIPKYTLSNICPVVSTCLGWMIHHENEEICQLKSMKKEEKPISTIFTGPNIITGSITHQEKTKWELLSRRRTGSYWMRADGGRHGAGKTRSFDAKRFFWTSITCTVNNFRMDSATKRSTISYAATTRNDFKSIRNNLKGLTLLKSFHIYSTIVVIRYPLSS